MPVIAMPSSSIDASVTVIFTSGNFFSSTFGWGFVFSTACFSLPFFVLGGIGGFVRYAAALQPFATIGNSLLW